MVTIVLIGAYPQVTPLGIGIEANWHALVSCVSGIRRLRADDIAGSPQMHSPCRTLEPGKTLRTSAPTFFRGADRAGRFDCANRRAGAKGPPWRVLLMLIDAAVRRGFIVTKAVSLLVGRPSQGKEPDQLDLAGLSDGGRLSPFVVYALAGASQLTSS